MGAEEALEFVDNLVFLTRGKHLDKTERIILRHLWEDEKRTYQDIANSSSYTEAHLKAVGAELWHLLSKVLREKVSKSTFQGVVQGFRTTQESQKISNISNLAGNEAKPQDLDSNFVGRDRQIADLHTIVSRGAKVILIQGEGGVGKTTLARKYFKTQKFNFVLELWMATEIQNITPVESVVEEWLRRDFNEEPGRDFGINLERLRRKLREQTSKIGVFIDNLETALDKNGKFLEYRRPYVQLLRVLADVDVHSVTLVTSRERLCESSVEVNLYPLGGLDDEAISRLRLVSEEWELVNRKAAGFWTQQVEIIKNINDALTALEAYYHYVEIRNFEQAGDVILQGQGKQWSIGLPLGCSFYQLGLLQKNFSVIKRLIDNIKSPERLIKLYNILGYTYRIIGCIREAIECYDQSGKILDQLDEKPTKLSILFNTGLCKLELWEIEAAEDCFNSVCSLAEQNSSLDDYMAYAECSLALIKSYSGRGEDAFNLAENAFSAMSSSTKVTLWGIGHSLVNLSLTYKNLGNLNKSVELCQQAIFDSDENNFTQIKAKAISCLAELFREQREFPRAIFYHSEAIEILDKIGAKSDLAEAYYQLALTHKKMGEIDQSRESFVQAIALFNEMQAPRQVEKVETAMEYFEK